MNLWGDEPVKRGLGIRDRQILYDRSRHKCENCGRDIEFSDMQVGHKTAYSRGGGTTLRNSACLCYGCNKKQGTDNWDVFQRKQGKAVTVDRIRDLLSGLNLRKLKYLASKHDVKIKGRLVEGGLFSDDYRQPPSKTRYVKALAGIISENDLQSELSGMPAPAKKRRRAPDSWL